MEDYPNNSNAYRTAQTRVIPAASTNAVAKQEEPVPAPIVTGTVKKKKKTFGMKLKELFVKEDAKSVSQYIFGDILIPALTNTILDTIKNGAEMIFLGRTGGPSYSNRSGGRIRYENYWDRDRDYEYQGRRPQYNAPRSAPTYSYDNMTFESRGDAEAVLLKLKERIYDSGAVSIAFLYHLVGWSADYTADGWGWRDLRDATIVMSSDGYWLRLPRPVVI